MPFSYEPVHRCSVRRVSNVKADCGKDPRPLYGRKVSSNFIFPFSSVSRQWSALSFRSYQQPNHVPGVVPILNGVMAVSIYMAFAGMFAGFAGARPAHHRNTPPAMRRSAMAAAKNLSTRIGLTVSRKQYSSYLSSTDLIRP